MACADSSEPSLLSKFQGCMIGALVGDCMGEKYEFCIPMPITLPGYMSEILKGERTKQLRYTDDTAMTLCIAKSLVEKGKIDPKNMAKRFVEEFYGNPNRCYGCHVIDVFKKLRDSNYADVFKPAQEQFNGQGSYGNGAAMRISPVALFASTKDTTYFKDAVERTSRVTHTHPYGINGALLQAFAINNALKLNPKNELDKEDFINQLEMKMKDIETVTNSISMEKDLIYCQSLQTIKDYLKKEGVDGKEIAEHLGNEVLAFKSVPSAVYCFLRGMYPLPEFECSNPFIRTIYFAISIGGDTDTIASMAGAIAGAYYGVEIIPQVVKDQCELFQEVAGVANKLYGRCYSTCNIH